MRYIALIYSDETWFERQSEADQTAHLQRWDEFDEAIRAAGVVTGLGGALPGGDARHGRAPPGDARVGRCRFPGVPFVIGSPGGERRRLDPGGS